MGSRLMREGTSMPHRSVGCRSLIHWATWSVKSTCPVRSISPLAGRTTTSCLLWLMTQSGRRCWQQPGWTIREPNIPESDNKEINTHMATVRVKKVLNLAGAEAVMSAAETFAREKAYRVVIAIVDPEGHPVLVKRLPNAQVASVQVGIDKARTAAIFVRPSRALEAQV